jgi:hypothetical protein
MGEMSYMFIALLHKKRGINKKAAQKSRFF